MTEEVDGSNETTRRGFLEYGCNAIAYGLSTVLGFRTVSKVRDGLKDDSAEKSKYNIQRLGDVLKAFEVSTNPDLDTYLRRYYTACYIEKRESNALPIVEAFGYSNMDTADLDGYKPLKVREEIERGYSKTLQAKLDDKSKLLLEGGADPLVRILDQIKHLAESYQSDNIKLSRCVMDQVSGGLTDRLAFYQKTFPARTGELVAANVR